MRRLIYSLSTLLFCFSFHSQAQLSVKKKNLSKIQYEYWDKNKIHLKAKGSFYQDRVNKTTKKHGTWLYYSKEGILEEEVNYYIDSLHGKYLSFWNGKQIKQESYYYQGIPDSIFKIWNETGILLLDGFFDYGTKADIWYYFYDDGRAKLEEKYVSGVCFIDNFWINDSLHTQTIKNGFGSTKSYFKSGKIKEVFQIVEGLKNGVYQEYSARGSLLIDGYYKNGFKDSCWYTFFTNQQIEKIACYKQDTLYGEYTTYNEVGNIRVHGFFESGKKYGKWEWYGDNGKLDSEGSFLNDLQEGEWRYYFSNGELSYKAKFKEGKRDGEWEYYYSQLKLYKRGSYINDKKEGLWRTWDENGGLIMEGSFKENNEEGEWKNYWENGKLKNLAFFIKGKLNGEWKSFSPYGKLKVDGFYKNDLQTGKWMEWFENGRPKEIINYKFIRKKSKANDMILKGRIHKLSVKHGAFVTFSNKDFQPTEEGNYKNGEKHGIWYAYHQGGAIIAVSNEYKKGKLHGVSKQFDRRGKVIQISSYKNGLLNGAMRFYDERGKMIKEIYFKNGQRASNTKQFQP
ncbi:MAG: toxin-antitoxin system YwqK family antitoxin [Bacteroidota bacterium]